MRKGYKTGKRSKCMDRLFEICLRHRQRKVMALVEKM